ncbi:MAG: ABC transporter ATP-binding protein [Anaerolineae bacterium]|nr:ABC transporter ATP-binding protein [Anaerolineae bacterium]
MIDVQDLTFTYAGTEKPAVRNLRFHIERGEIFGFLGPSGAGKSTTQKILIRLLRDFQGRVVVMDRPLDTWNGAYYERIGVSFEVPNLYQKLTGLENLRYYGSLYHGSKREPQLLLEWVGLEKDGDTLVSQYSKGMRNRLNVARALLHDPELLFMDEPTAGLDPVNARRIKDLIRSEREAGKTIFLTTHNMTVAEELCDRVAFIVDGEISLIDTPRTLKLDYGEPTVRVEYLEEGQTRAQRFPLEGLGENAAFLALLLAQQVQTLHSQEATLETIFIQVTGRSLT